MTFLNIVLLGGIAAASIPLIIHLFHRSRFRIVKWAAMHLLEPRQRTQKRRLRLEHLLLLLIRCAIPTVLALCMARPVLTGLQALVGTAKTSAVVLLDNSYSMEVSHAGRTTFVEARDAAAKIVANLGRGSEVSVLLMGGAPTPLLAEPTFATDRAGAELAKLKSGFGSAAVPAALEAGAGTLAKMHQAHRELIVVSDFQKISWSDTEADDRLRAADLLKHLPVPPVVTFLHLGREEKNNVCVESLDLSRFLVGVGQRFQVRAHLKNYGDISYSDLRVYFRVDGIERAASQITLGAHETAQVLFTYTFDAAGSHVIAVDADVADVLKFDNSLLAAVPVWDQLPVLLINGSPSAEPLRGATDFLEIALRPFAAAKGSLADLIATRTIAPGQLDANALKDVRVAVLANVAQLADAQVLAVQEFVRRGGGLLIFPGNHLNSAWYNARLAAAGVGLLPLPLAALGGSLDENAAPASILIQNYEHPALQLFNDPRNGSLANAAIRLWFKLGEKTGGDSFVLARLSTGDPFLVEKKLGDGQVIFCTVPCDAEWSNLPSRPFYLPLMQQLVTYLAAKVEPPRNVDVGRPLTALLPATVAGKALELTGPDGQKHALTATAGGGRAVAQFPDTHQPGLYVLELPDKSLVHFVVNTSRAESDLQQLTADEIKAVAKPFNATVVKSWDEYRQLEHRRRFGREFWRPLLWALLALIFAELLLQQRLGRRAR